MSPGLHEHSREDVAGVGLALDHAVDPASPADAAALDDVALADGNHSEETPAANSVQQCTSHSVLSPAAAMALFSPSMSAEACDVASPIPLSAPGIDLQGDALSHEPQQEDISHEPQQEDISHEPQQEEHMDDPLRDSGGSSQ